ncbi:carbohydrate kinase [Pleurocapsa sp. CCALA 161]|uniref:carbohydrate kinase family protein n=1 Tax=Pleurocapsa sp. CCALA 161 TaxID=2107688 RepID=UPI000D07E84D|nr:carbohydrate kinase [Pleurocapsa sp. CCALA 161]PSB10255.1 carbohydrate kinase [Pleurocapsa sp. CCALA 161]
MNNKAIAHRPAKVICLGEILFDCLADELGKSVSEVTSWTSYPGGAPANVASALTKLGTPSAFIGCVGKDDPGKELIQLLQSIGVDISGVQYTEQAPTRQVYVTRTPQGDRTFAGFGKQPADRFADAYLQANLLPVELFLEAEYLVIGTLELAYPHSRSAVFRALKLAEEYHLKIILDVNWRPMFWLNEQEALPLIEQLWSYVDFIKLAEEEARWLFETADAGAIFYRLGSVEGVLVSNGAAQVSYCLGENEGKVSPFPIEVIDTTGAGDAFLAGFIHQLCQRGLQELSNPQVADDIVKYACAVGGLTTTKLGAIAAQPSPQLVQALLAKF